VGELLGQGGFQGVELLFWIIILDGVPGRSTWTMSVVILSRPKSTVIYFFERGTRGWIQLLASLSSVTCLDEFL
jgi:hypothetical protein